MRTFATSVIICLFMLFWYRCIKEACQEEKKKVPGFWLTLTALSLIAVPVVLILWVWGVVP